MKQKVLLNFKNAGTRTENVTLTFSRGLEIPEHNEKNMPMI